MLIPMVSGCSHTSNEIELIAHAWAPPNKIPNTKGETLVELYDDAYYFWHPGTETFLSEGPEYLTFGSPTAVHPWDVRQSSPQGNIYYTFWGQELKGKRKMVLELFAMDLTPGTRIVTYNHLAGDNQKLVLRSDGDKDGQVIHSDLAITT